jgi:hypothetical protein
MSSRYIEQAPDNVIWRNMALTAYEVNVRRAASYAATVGLILLWTIPGESLGLATLIKPSRFHRCIGEHRYLGKEVSLVGLDRWRLVGKACASRGDQRYPTAYSAGLGHVDLANDLETWVTYNGLVVSVLIDSELAAFEGIPSKTNVELDLMTRYFIFLVIVGLI